MSKTVVTIAGDFDEARYKDFKKAYNAAVSVKGEYFSFEGQTILVSFAKYLIEFLEQTFKP